MNPKKILDKLKTLMDVKFGDILANNKITLIDFSRRTGKVVEVEDSKKLVIDISKLDHDTQKQIKEQILDKVINQEDEAFLTDRSKANTESIKRNLPEKDDELLMFYQGKLSPTMYKVLEGALVVRNAANKREDIRDLKWGIARQYPDIGNNMCNLVGRGYFDGHFKELYKSMAEEGDFDIIDYQEKVKYIVKALPYIVFVDQYRDYAEISGEVKFKLDKLKKYGAGKLVLHGLSKANVKTTLDILSEYEDDATIRIERDMNKAKTIITATLIF